MENIQNIFIDTGDSRNAGLLKENLPGPVLYASDAYTTAAEDRVAQGGCRLDPYEERVHDEACGK